MALVGVNEILWRYYLYEIDGREKYEYKGNNLLITRIHNNYIYILFSV